MYGVCCDLEYCRVDGVSLNTAHGRIWPPSDVRIFRWKHMHYHGPEGRQRERGCFWQADIPGNPEAGNRSMPTPGDPAALGGTMAGIR